MACAYLLSLGNRPISPQLKRSNSIEQLVKMHADDTIKVVSEEADGDLVTNPLLTSDVLDQRTLILDSEDLAPQAPTNAIVWTESSSYSLMDVLELHTSRRMKAFSAPGKRVKHGVSIPSQQRFLYYWTLLLAQNEVPAHFWHSPANLKRPKVRLIQIVLRIREPPTVKMSLARAANFVIGQTEMGVRNEGMGRGPVWGSLAKYDDEMVDLLEIWEQYTRDENHIGWRRPGSERMGSDELNRVFKDGKWDKGKMVGSFARLGVVSDITIEKSKENKVCVYPRRDTTEFSFTGRTQRSSRTRCAPFPIRNRIKFVTNPTICGIVIL
jgi:phosphatidylinositol-3,4,5-trisphosphate 3-phosphatase and dual-specificity protein phosphatase PTEN